MLLHYGRVLSGAPVGGGWQLAAGHYEPSKAEPIIVYPRSDANSHATERHRLAPAGRRWAIPVAMYSGSWPFHYSVDATSAAKGISIGAQLIPSGDVLIVGDDYAELSWDNPTIGSHVITVTVRDQEYGRNTTGFSSEKTVTFTLEVVAADDTTKFVWLSGTGNDTTGAGTPSSPFRSLNKVFGNSDFNGRQCHLLSGTYDTDTTGYVALNFSTPAVIVADHGATATANLTADATKTAGVFIYSSDGCGIFGLKTSEGGHGGSVANQRIIKVNSGVDNYVVHRCNFANPANGTAGNDNCTSIYSDTGSSARLNACITRNTESGRASSSNSAGLFVLFQSDQGVAEFNTVNGDAAYNYALKDSNRRWSIRSNTLDLTNPENNYGLATGGQAQSYRTDDIEISYNKVDGKIVINWQSESNTDEVHVFRNSCTQGIRWKNASDAGNGPWYDTKNACEGTNETGSRVTESGTECRAATGVIDTDMNLEGSYRAGYLGIRGAEAA